MKAHYYTNLVEGGRTIQREAQFEESDVNKIVRVVQHVSVGFRTSDKMISHSIKNDSKQLHLII